MAAIGSIRKYSGFLIGAIGISLVGFLIMDFTNSQFSVLKGRKDSVGKVNGEKISYSDFTKKYEETIKNTEEQMRGQSMSDDQRNYLRTQTWNEMVNEIIYNKIYTQLGIGITSDEMRELAMGANVHPYVRQSFSDPQTHQFDPARVNLFLQNLDKDEEGAEPGTRRKQWLRFEAEMKKNQYQTKYDNLISKGFYIPTWQGEMLYNDQNTAVDFKYVQLPYSQINDADVKVSDDDIKKYLADHQAKYTQDEETRKFQYVTFDIVASPGDSAKIAASLQERRADFAKGEKRSDDSLFVKIYSEAPFDEVYYDKDALTSPVKDSFFALPVKSVIGPYVDGGSFKLAKITDRKMISDSVKVRDIVFPFQGITSQDAANQKFKLIDSVFKQIDSLKGDFGAFAAAFSGDQVSKMKGGDIGWVKKGEKEKLFNDFLFFRAEKGKTYRIPLQQENAIHIFQVVDTKPSKLAVQISYLTKEIIPSPETERNIYGNATNFAAENQSEAKFKEAGKKLNAKTVNSVQKDAYSVEGLGSAREVVKWAFNAKKGDVSSVFTVGKKHAVALLEEIRPKGLPDMESVRDRLKPVVIKEKKVEQLSGKITAAKAGSIDALASKLGVALAEASAVTFTNPSVNGAYEQLPAATALSIPVGKMSKPVKGSGGVYVVQPSAIRPPSPVNNYSVYSEQVKRPLEGKTRSAAEVQKKLADVQDNRADFF